MLPPCAWTATLNPIITLVCTRCKSVQDISGDFIDFKRLTPAGAGGFDLTEPMVEISVSASAVVPNPQNNS